MQNVRHLLKGRAPAAMVSGSEDGTAALQSKIFGGYLYPARQFEFYKPPSRKERRSGSEANSLESRWNLGYDAFRELPRRELVGAHTFFAFIGFSDLTREMYEMLAQRTKVPEAAVVAVRSEQVGIHLAPASSHLSHFLTQGLCKLPVYRAILLPQLFLFVPMASQWFEPMPEFVERIRMATQSSDLLNSSQRCSCAVLTICLSLELLHLLSRGLFSFASLVRRDVLHSFQEEM